MLHTYLTAGRVGHNPFLNGKQIVMIFVVNVISLLFFFPFASSMLTPNPPADEIGHDFRFKTDEKRRLEAAGYRQWV